MTNNAAILDILSNHNLWLMDERDGKRADLRDMDLRGVDLSGANLQSADCRGSYLRAADLRDTDLYNADMRDTDMQGVDLRGADMRDTDFQGANMKNADLRGVRLNGVNFQDAYLRGANFQDATIDKFQIVALIGRAWRGDEYEAFLFRTRCGHVLMFGSNTMTIPQYREHALQRYPGTQKYTATIATLDYLESRLNALMLAP